MHALPRKLFWLSFWVIGFAVFMTGLLLYFKYQSVFTGLQRERVLMVAREIDSIAEKNLSLGQDFWDMGTLQDVIERRGKADQLFIGIDVAGQDGKIAYSTDLSRMGSKLPAEWVDALARNPNLTSLPPTRDQAVAVSGIRNGFNQQAGFAVIRYGRVLEHEAMAAFARKLAANCLIVFVVSTLGLFAILVWLERRMERAFAKAASAMGVSPGSAGPHPLAGELALIQAQFDAAGQGLGAVEANLEPVR
ncbi:hypothetical protein BWI17_19450 [Betaproteobacteria bacterium GR16-43]|nr:hypothetical protein BWI17_19450 [Betaproteobacteria bacterium GR16-43]